MAKAFTNPIIHGKEITSIPHELLNALDYLRANSKLTMILRSKSTYLPSITVEDLVQLVVKSGEQKGVSGYHLVLFYLLIEELAP